MENSVSNAIVEWFFTSFLMICKIKLVKSQYEVGVEALVNTYTDATLFSHKI